MINIKKIEVTGYRLLEDTSLDFTNKKGLISLKGVNNDFFESNGSGKTTLPNAICQILYGENLERLPQKEINSIYSGSKFRGYLELEVNNQRVTIERDYGKNTFDFWVDGVVDMVANKKTKQERLDKIIGLSFDTFNKLFYLSPNRISMFSKSDDTSQGKFIKELLSLEFISGINKRADLELKHLKNETDYKLKEQDLNEKQLGYIKDQISLLKTTTFDVKELMTLKGELEELQYNKKKALKELKDYKSLMENKKQVYDEKIAERRMKKASLEEQQRIALLNVCPTCQQKITTKSEITEWIKNEENKSKDLTDEINKIFHEHSSMKLVLAPMENKFAETTKKEILLEQDIKRLETIQKQGDNTDKAKMKKKLETDMKELSDKIVQQEIILRELRDKIYVLELIKASTSSKGYIKERINLFIELMNNQLDKISNQIMGGETGIWIVRTEKNNFEVMIQDTKGQLSYSNLSAGTKQRVDILLALALNLAIKTLTGIDINMLFFDEIFSNIDSQGRKDIENLLQRISNKFPDKMIITVLHGNDISSNHTILVTRENYQSKLSWA